jgi:hypothetical protein
MNKLMVAGAVVVFSAAIAEPVLARQPATPKPRPTYHHPVHEYRAQPDLTPYPLPHALDRRDPSRPGGLDPSFNPPRT